MKLGSVFTKHKCDKSKKHQYDVVYEKYFDQDKELKILEVGIFRGESMKAHLEYLPKATLYGIDLFDRIKPEYIPVLEDPRVNWISSSSMAEELPDLIREKWGDIKFDIIIDDGAHWPEANRLTLHNLKDFLKDDGVYFIEDVWPIEDMDITKNHWTKARPERYNKKDNDIFLDYIKQFIVERYDHRIITGNADSYIIKLTKK